jgi:ABC-type multidrug transport system ATPase subunit
MENLTKKFGDFTAVSNLKFSIREGEVFTFLGHNGAGKTTTIFMLTGMLDATSGDAKVYGYSILDNISVIQKNLGLCQQFDVLFETLTVWQHLWLVCELKNVNENEMD